MADGGRGGEAGPAPPRRSKRARLPQVDDEEEKATKAFNTDADRKKNKMRRQSIGDVLTNVAVDSKVSMKNSVEDFRHEFGVFEEPEELLELCNGMLQVADLVDAKRFYYNHGLHNNNRSFRDADAVCKACDAIELRSGHALASALDSDYANLVTMWSTNFLTLSFFEFITTLASYLRARQRLS